MTHATTTTQASERNRLQHEKSPYLLQHADNPVDWYPWGEAAFEKARKEDKPVFLSIGYSTCHWCHVMEHESFEDPEVARLMNEVFVCVKVDREERPDIDSVYMTVCQMMTGSGGWPLTVFLTPDKKPFYAGTYIPKEARFGRMGMMQLIPRVKEMWQASRAEIEQSADQVTAALHDTAPDGGGEALDAAVLESATRQLAMRFDDRHGGFGDSPKFPTPHNLTFLLRQWKRSGEPAPLGMVEKTLRKMRLGGIYDHVGFGFHRYATDRHWLVPHFEKMLYDQALLAIAYLETYQATRDEDFARTAREIFTYVLRDMTSPDGGFYSAEDADSEGVEGKFYVWTLEEIRAALDDADTELVTRIFGVVPEGNFSDEATGRRTGANILHLIRPLRAWAKEFDLSETELEEKIETARQKLFARREQRVHPHKDDKILTDWNGLMIAALARGGRVLDDATYTEAAAKAVRFVLEKLRTPERGRLLHRYREGHASIPAYVDDYAFFIWGLLELYETTFDSSYLRTALDMNAEMLDLFWDESGGGLFLVADDAEAMLVRQKEVYDGAVPSGNSVAMLNLLRLARITGKTEPEERAAGIGKAFSTSVREMPAAHTQLLLALDLAMGPAHEIVVAGEPTSDDTRAMLRALRGSFVPNKVVLLRATGETNGGITELAPWTADHTPMDGKATAYVCTNQACDRPTTDPEKLIERLAE